MGRALREVGSKEVGTKEVLTSALLCVWKTEGRSTRSASVGGFPENPPAPGQAENKIRLTFTPVCFTCFISFREGAVRRPFFVHTESQTQGID